MDRNKKAWITDCQERQSIREFEQAVDVFCFPNLMDTHPIRDSFVFQIDGNFGAMAVIAIVQSDDISLVIITV